MATKTTDNLCIINLHLANSGNSLIYYFPANGRFGMPDPNTKVKDIMCYNSRQIGVIVMSKKAIWSDNSADWTVDSRYPHILVMKSNGTDWQCDETDIDALNVHLNGNPSSLPKTMSVSKVDWWSIFLDDLIFSNPIEKTPTTTKKNPEKFKWCAENPRTLVKVPDGVRSVKINIKYSDDSDDEYFTFVKSDGYTTSLDREDLGHISSIDVSLPYIWIGLPPGTEYISCGSEFVYKFSDESRNYYRSVSFISSLLPRNYQYVRKGSINKLRYSEETEKHEPPITKNGVLIMGRS